MEGEYENNSPPHDKGYFIILFPSVSTKATKAPAEKRIKALGSR